MRVNLEIMSFVEQQILPRYNAFGQSHGLHHVSSVIDRSVKLAQKLGVDTDMAYVIAAYHDLGMEGPRAIHHITGGKILITDARLKRWFSAEQLKIMKEAVEDHRASSSRAPRSIYGKIVAEADRDLTPDVVFSRTVLFGLENYPEKSEAEQWEHFREHMHNKYGENGYIRLWLPNSPNAESLKLIRQTIADEPQLRQAFQRFYQQFACRK